MILIRTILVLLFFVPLVHAEDVYPNVHGFLVNKDDDWYKKCIQVRDEHPPSGDFPSEQETKSLADCSASDIYYDTIQMPGATSNDWLRVRNCAFRQSDNAVLMMLYANGLGVSRNIDLAMNYSCKIGIEIGSSPVDLADRLRHLAKIQKDGIGTFDLCDDIESKGLATHCAEMRDSGPEKERKLRISRLTNEWNASQRASFNKLWWALSEYARRHGFEEIDQSGRDGPSAVWEHQDQATVIDPFLSSMKAFEEGNLPRYSDEEFEHLDRELNQLYKRIMEANLGKGSYLGDTLISKDGIKHTQRAWLKYRNSLVDFGKVKYPKVSEASWKAFCTKQRNEQLLKLLSLTAQK